MRIYGYTDTRNPLESVTVRNCGGVQFTPQHVVFLTESKDEILMAVLAKYVDNLGHWEESED